MILASLLIKIQNEEGFHLIETKNRFHEQLDRPKPF